MKLIPFILAFFLPLSSFAEVIDLSKAEYRIYSQNGEDGVIQKLFEVVGTSSKYYVEFGAADGSWLSNTKLLRENYAWQGLLLDCGHENVNINLHKEFITAENINELFYKYGVPEDLDLLSIDIDFNDFYVWHAIDFRPKVVVIEYNVAHLPHEDKVVKYDPNNMWDGTNYFGASMLAMYNLGRSKGYSLVYAEKSGTNLFFVRDDLIQDEFINMNDVNKLYIYGVYGHPKDPKMRAYISSDQILPGR